MRRIKLFFYNGILLTLTGLIIRTAYMFFNVYISNKIGAEAIGVYQLIMSVYLFSITVANSGINLATTRIVAEEDTLNNNFVTSKIMKKCLLYSIFTGCISCIILFIISKFSTAHFLHSKVSELPLQILACSLPFLALTSCINGYFSGLRKIKNTVYCQIFEGIVKILLVITFLNYFFRAYSIEQACIALVLSTTISEIFSFLFLLFLFLKGKKLSFCKVAYRKIKISESKERTENKLFVHAKNEFSKELTKKILRIAIPISFTSYIRSGLSCLKQVLIPIQLEKSGLNCSLALSQYGIINGMAFPLIMFPCFFITSFSSLLIPEFAQMNIKKENSKINYALNKILKFCFIFSILIMGFFWCFSKELSNFIYPNVDVSFYIKLLCPLVILMYIDNVVDSVLKGLDKQVSVMAINIIDLVTTILIIYFLLPIKGVNGYIFALFVSEILNGILSLLLLIKQTHFKINFMNFIFKPFLCIIMLNLIFTFFNLHELNNVFKFVFYCFLFIISYFLMLLGLRSICIIENLKNFPKL